MTIHGRVAVLAEIYMLDVISWSELLVSRDTPYRILVFEVSVGVHVV